jgi:hypothetical protein
VLAALVLAGPVLGGELHRISVPNLVFTAADHVERVPWSDRFVLRRTDAPTALLTALVPGPVDP